jgi:hypothetical protein
MGGRGGRVPGRSVTSLPLDPTDFGSSVRKFGQETAVCRRLEMAGPQGRYISPVLSISYCFVMPIVGAGEGAWTTFDRCISPARASHDCRQGVTSLPVRRCISPRKCCFSLLKQGFTSPSCSLPVLPVTLLGSTAAFKSPNRSRAPEEQRAQDSHHASIGPESHTPISRAN